MQNWQIQKNRIDMDYQQDLQKYQIILGASYAVPLTVFGLILSFGITPNNFLAAVLSSFLVFLVLKSKENEIKNTLTNHKRKVSKIKL